MAPLYHYTSLEGARGAREAGYLRAQYPHNGLVRHRFPPGVYFTALGPSTARARLLQNNYDGFLTLVGLTDRRSLERRLDCYFRVESTLLDPEKLFDNSNEARSEWIYFGDVTISEDCGFNMTPSDVTLSEDCEINMKPPDVTLSEGCELNMTSR